jgi:enterochelin esterase-like enzyme
MPESLIHDHLIPSNAVGNVMNIRVVTPPGYSPERAYPVVYLLHLWGRDERFWTDRLAAHVRLAEGIQAGTLPR